MSLMLLKVHRYLFTTTNRSYENLGSSFSLDYQVNTHRYLHKSTGARIYYLQKDDSDNCFASMIRTYPNNDLGCAHILEHLVCCGSQKYPVRDLLFSMIKRSVNTYMNAWTGSDFTCYPFSSPNTTDWDNLYRIYLDMSMKPLLKELDFLQEGWRYEFNAKGQRQIKGIVLNEMKGYYQSSQRQLFTAINKILFKDTPYAFDSGGVPSQIIKVTYAQIQAMHKYYYHPSNMVYYFYGNNPIHEKLQYLSQYLSGYENLSGKYELNLKPNICISEHEVILKSSTAECSTMSINYFLGQFQKISAVENMCLKIISYMLLEGNQAHIYRKFIESGIASTLGISGYNQEKLSTFTITLKDTKQGYTLNEFYNEFTNLLHNMIRNGIQQNRLQQYVHQNQVDVLMPHAKNGIRLLCKFINLINHNYNIQAYMQPTKVLAQARKLLTDKVQLNRIIEKYFIKNQQWINVLQQQQNKVEELFLESPVKFSDEKIKKYQQQLQKKHQQQEDVSLLPNLSLKDLESKGFIQPICLNSTKLFKQYHIPITHNVNYFRLVFNFKFVPSKVLKKLSLWKYAIDKGISTPSFNRYQLSSKMNRIVGKFQLTMEVGHQGSVNIIFYGACLPKNSQEYFKLLEEIIMTPIFEKDNMNYICKSYIRDMTENFIEEPIQYCIDEGGATISFCSAMMNKYNLIKNGLQIAKNYEAGIQQVNLFLHKCENITFIQHSMKLQQIYWLEKLLAIKKPSQIEKQIQFKPVSTQKAVIYSHYDVNFCTQQYVGCKILSNDHAYLNLFLQVLEQDYLHPCIRERGGAYGSRAMIRSSGLIVLYSYMDPQTTKTFAAFDQCIKNLINKGISDSQLIEAKIKQIGSIDEPKTPQQNGLDQILKRYSQQQLTHFRNTLLAATADNVIECGRQYLVNNTVKSKVIFGKEIPEGFTHENLEQFI